MSGVPRVGVGSTSTPSRTRTPVATWIAGLHWPGERGGLDGHSDADVACHAACDAFVLGRRHR